MGPTRSVAPFQHVRWYTIVDQGNNACKSDSRLRPTPDAALVRACRGRLQRAGGQVPGLCLLQGARQTLSHNGWRASARHNEDFESEAPGAFQCFALDCRCEDYRPKQRYRPCVLACRGRLVASEARWRASARSTMGPARSDDSSRCKRSMRRCSCVLVALAPAFQLALSLRSASCSCDDVCFADSSSRAFSLRSAFCSLPNRWLCQCCKLRVPLPLLVGSMPALQTAPAAPKACPWPPARRQARSI